MTVKTVGRAELGAVRCAVPGCECNPGPVRVLQRCCPAFSGLRVAYDDGVLVVSCFVCREEVTRIVVGEVS